MTFTMIAVQRLRQTVFTVAGLIHGMAVFAQRPGEAAGKIGLVFDNERAHALSTACRVMKLRAR